MEISNPGGLYGRLTVDQLGKVQPDTRNPVIANAMEVMGKTENRYSGIPTVRRLAQEFGLPEPEFVDARGEFKVVLRKASKALGTKEDAEETNIVLTEKDGEILAFCADFKSRNQIAEHLGIGADYAMRKYVKPLVKANMLELEDKANPRSHSQRYRISARGYSFL